MFYSQYTLLHLIWYEDFILNTAYIKNKWIRFTFIALSEDGYGCENFMLQPPKLL